MKEGVKHGCNPSPYLFNVFIEDTVCIMNAENAHAPVLGN
jgi:hypothetical protein